MQAQQLNLNVISNNIANVNTTGYKKNKIEFQDLLYQNPRQAGGQTGAGNVIPTGVEMGNGTKVVSTAKIFTQGQLTQTSEKMDVAIDGVGNALCIFDDTWDVLAFQGLGGCTGTPLPRHCLVEPLQGAFVICEQRL